MLSARSCLLFLSVLGALSCGAGATTGAPQPDASATASEAPTASASAAPEPQAEGLRWRASKVTFATVEEGRALLGAEDAFTRTLGPLDRQLRMRVTTEVGDGAFRAHVAAQVVQWTEADRARWTAAAERLGAALEHLALPLPPAIAIVQTTGKDELDAAYTRGAAIVLPTRDVAKVKSPLTLLAHELFHVATRHDPSLRKKLFPLIGFQSVDAVPLPKALEPKRLTNPDAFINDFAIRVKQRKGTRSFLGVPLLYCALPLSDAIERGLGEAIGISLVELDDAGKVVVQGGEPVLHEAGATSFMEVASVNTDYAIHPEEVLADNFAMIVAERSGAPERVEDNAVLEKIAEALK